MLAFDDIANEFRPTHARLAVSLVAHEGRRSWAIHRCNFGECGGGKFPTIGTRSVDNFAIFVERQKRSIEKFLTQGIMSSWHRRAESCPLLLLATGSFFFVLCSEAAVEIAIAIAIIFDSHSRFAVKGKIPFFSVTSFFGKAV